MKRSFWIVTALALALVFPGCVLTSGQIRIDFSLDNFTASTDSAISGQQINLGDQSEYEKNKDKLKDLSDLAVLGRIKNNGTNTIHVEVWMTPTLTSYTSVGALKGDNTARQVWGPFTLASDQSKVIDWDGSAKLFNSAGKAMLLSEAKGDGMFTLYAIAQEGTYNFSVDQGELILVLDVGI
jgi:hypothetical protein